MFDIIRIPIAHIDSGGKHFGEKTIFPGGGIKFLSIPRANEDANFVCPKTVLAKTFAPVLLIATQNE